MKKLEHAWKALLYDGDTVSVHRPSFYSERFERFMFGKVFVSLPMTESLRRLNAQNKQRPKLKKTPEEEIKNIEEEISVEEIVLPSNDQLTNEILPSNEQNKAESAETNQELAVPQLEPPVAEPEPSVTEPEPFVTEPKLSVTGPEPPVTEIIADNNDYNLQKESSLQIVTNVVTTPVTVPNQTETDCDIGTVSDEGDAKQKDQLLSRKIDTSSGKIFRDKF